MFEKNSIDVELNSEQSTRSEDESKSIDTAKYKIAKPKKKNNIVDFDVIKKIKNNKPNPQETKDVDGLKR